MLHLLPLSSHLLPPSPPDFPSRLRAPLFGVSQDPVEHIEAVPSESNILEWHYLIHGPPNTPYAGGLYHGKLVFPSQYPYRPPSILMLTPSGRFKTNTRLCLSMSDFHPETWNPLWSVSSILSGLLSFMLENTATYGSMETSEEMRRQLAAKSEDWNVDNNRPFNEHFPQYKQRREERREHGRKQSDSHTNGSHPAAKAAATPAGAAQAGKAGEAGNGRRAGAGAAGKPHPDATVDKLVIAIVVVSVAFGVMYLYTS